MARADQVKALLLAYAGNEESRFISVALQVAAEEANKGHAKHASELRDIIEQVRSNGAAKARSGAVPLVQPRGELAELLTVQYPKQYLTHMVLGEDVAKKLQRVLTEQQAYSLLTSHGLKPRRKLLLVGPPGTGKTLTASMLATEIMRPLFVVRFDSLINKFMGESASKLKLVFDALKATRGVYLFDEFDSLGLQRGSQHDVAEMRRTLNMFLQLIEQDQSESMIVAATNHGASLDEALFRRFDDIIRYSPPTEVQIEALIRNSVAFMAPSHLDYQNLARCGNGLPHSEIVRACSDAMKDAVLQERDKVSQEDIAAHLADRRQSQPVNV